MNELTDQQLLRDYAEHHSETAFTTLVRRHIDLVHSAAFRLTVEAHSAQDVTQAVFVALAQNADRLAQHPVLSGWLHTTARNLAAKYVRTAVRRQNHEQEAVAMNELLATASETSWKTIAPQLDAALGELTEPDRDAVLLRYFEKKSAQEMAALLGISDEAAQKRVSRAVEKLRELFAKRGVTVGAGGLVVVISANAVQAAPVGLAVTISAAIAGTVVTTSTVLAATTKTIAMTALQKTLVTATVAVLAGAGIYEARQASQLREQNQTLQQERAPLAEQNQQLQRERDDATQHVAEMTGPEGTKIDNSELLRLRGEVGRLRRESTEAKTPITRDQVESRYKNAQELARRGDSAAALKEFLWCFDEGMQKISGYTGVRTSFLLSSIAKLGDEYPVALTALRERRDKAAQQMLNSANDSDAATDFAAINRAVNEDQITLTMFDQLPTEDPRRQTLASVAYDQLIEAQRYEDAILGRPYAKLSTTFELMAKERPLPANTPNAEMIRNAQRKSLINLTARNVEALAGAGEIEHARTLAQRLLGTDNSPATKALLQQHVVRAGQAGLLDNMPNP